MLEDFKVRFYQILMASVDFFLVFLSFQVSVYVYRLIDSTTLTTSDFVAVSVSCVSLILLFFFDCYSLVKRKSLKFIFGNSFLALLLSNLPFLFIANPQVVFFSFIIQILLIGFIRYGWWSVSKIQSGQKKVWIISNDADERNRNVNKLLNHASGWFELSGTISAKEYQTINQYDSDLDAILLCPSVKGEQKDEVIQYFSHAKIEILLIPDFTDLLVATSHPQQLDDRMIYSIQPPYITKSNEISKRVFDLVISTILLVISSPIMLFLYILIPLTSKGSALYLQERIGLNGKPYSIYKFRSMENNAEKMTGPTLAASNDPRVTSVGKWIRATRLDELPQLFNVLRGDMSIVGPRPERDYFVKQFKDEIPEYEDRLTVKPGITGLAQVLANYTTTVEDKLHYDLLYIRHYTLVLDIKILLQTLRVIVQRDQAQGVSIQSLVSPKDFALSPLKINKQHKA
ncbi:sugar transferase [Fictibacillus phosphorivorans]|uniref:sugar transferase n=1 Tax=Fictibacillus phosphorivorans TaxID=1221500 RepID=UPI00203F3812|nr:sugar transferase [Fictibacillus phosphorivorans]MCM3717693.1 sugar transferase [Fictibacillus phosphorivorans]MCM3775593.1 sugar transferase [Fictibacillus phosphorivorans]